MWKRPFWIDSIQSRLSRRSILWLTGVRRAGKTTLVQSIQGAHYFDCERPRVRRMLEDPESFLEAHPKEILILDEIQRLDDPSSILKIAADHFRTTRIIATGSSTLGASVKFKDTLTGRKSDLWLTPIKVAELHEFHVTDLKLRMIQGGLPPFLLANPPAESDYQEWVDSYWAKDVLELFRLEKRHSFQKFLELLLVQSGGLFEASSFAAPCEVSRPTISNYLSVLEATHIAHILRPFHRSASNEIITAPKVYGFDTGFICYFKGWTELRPDDRGILWEHLVLNELQADLPGAEIQYWRDKRAHEVDFVIAGRKKPDVVAIECKWKARQFDPRGIEAFRNRYPDGINFVVSSDVDSSYTQKIGKHRYRFVSIISLAKEIAEAA